MTDPDQSTADSDPNPYDRVDLSVAPTEPSGKSGTPTVYLTDRLGLTETRATLRRLEPGASMPYHHENTQEELYLLVEGEGSMYVDGERLDATPGTLVRVSPETPRQLFNDADIECAWLVVGAPPTGHDGTVLGPGPAAEE